MISESLMDTFGIDKTKAYKITNPLSNDWLYLRPQLFPSVANSVCDNLRIREDFQVFELSMAYRYREGNLPEEIPTLIVVWTGEKFREAKGLAEALFAIMGINFDAAVSENKPHQHNWYTKQSLTIGSYGSLGVLNQELLTKLHVTKPLTRLYLDFGQMVLHANPIKQYRPIPKYPPIIEDLSFDLVGNPTVKSMIDELSKHSKLIHSITLLDSYKNSRTFRITYLDPDKTLTVDDVKPIREKLIEIAGRLFNATLKGS
jgi:phenylalanyl-tRNA synthetase beta chain